MLLEAALDRISVFAAATPRARIRGFLEKLKRGEAFDVALILESVAKRDLAALNEICECQMLREEPRLLGELIDSAYRIHASSPVEPRIAWTGPRLDPALRFTQTGIAARSIVDSALDRILIAGYHVTSDNLEEIGVWSAISRHVSVTILVDGKDLRPADANIFRAKGLVLHEISGNSRDYSKFHVKAIVSDGVRALVGSANFTTLGHTSNIELGLIVAGSPALAIEATLLGYLKVAVSTGWSISTI